MSATNPALPQRPCPKQCGGQMWLEHHAEWLPPIQYVCATCGYHEPSTAEARRLYGEE